MPTPNRFSDYDNDNDPDPVTQAIADRI